MRQKNYDPTKWAQDQKNKVDRARQLREERKFGKGTLPMDQPQENYRQKFDYNDPVTDDQIQQAQNSLQLLKQKMAKTRQQCFDTYDTINENQNYIPEPNQYNQNISNQKQMNYQQYSSQMQQNYPLEQKPKNNYRKVFNPNIEVDALDQEIQNLNKQIGTLNQNIQQKTLPQQNRQYSQQIYSQNPFQNAGNNFLQEKSNLNYEQKPPIKKVEKKPLHHLSKYDDEQDNIYKGAFAYNPDEYIKQQSIEDKNRGEQKSKQKVQKPNDFNIQEEQHKINENTGKYGNYKYNDQAEFSEQTYQQPQKTKPINKFDNYNQQDKQYNNSRNSQNQGYPSSQNQGYPPSQMNNQPSKLNQRSKVQQQQQSQNTQAMTSSSQNKQKPQIGKDISNDNRPAFAGAGNQFDLNQEDENEPIVQCKQGCGRSFKISVLAKHEGICKKVFQKKRKVFDSQKNRIIDEQHEQLLQEQIYMKKKKPQGKQQQQQQQGNKKSKWKMQSEAFRAMLKVGKGDGLSAKEQAKMDQFMQEQDTRLQCQWCGRKFNENAYNKHIPICENNFKKTQNKNNQTRPRNKKY